jgi:hypothetical protein
MWHKRDQYTYVMHGLTYLYCDNQALSIAGSDLVVINALPLLLSYLRCLNNPQYN